MVANRHATGRFAGHRDLAGIAAEVGDVVAHPAQRRLLVGQPVIAHLARRTQCRMRQEAERAETVVERDDDDVAPTGQPARVIHVAAAVDEAPP